MSQMISFEFDTSAVRVVTDAKGETWFVASDIASVLDYRNAPDMTRNLDDDEKGTHIVRSRSENGVEQDREVTVINESGLYSAILKSRKPEAKRFKKWVTAEVLPTLRKTGEYKVPRKREPSLITRAGQAASLFHKLKGVAEACGLSGNAAIISANNGVTKLTGVNLLVDMNTTHLVADSRGKTWTPTEIAKRLGLGSPQIVNRLLLSMDYQKKAGDTWLPTEKGQPHGEWYDTGKRHSDGAPVKQWKWFESVVDVIRVVG